MHFYRMISCDLSSSEVGSLNSKWKLSLERLTLGQVQRIGECKNQFVLES